MESSANDNSSSTPRSSVSPVSGMSPNLAAALSYVLGAITGVLFYLISKDKFVRFHAIQSIITSLALWAVSLVLGILPGLSALSPLISLASFALFIFLIVKAYRGEKFKLPVAGDLAEKNA